ncbi:leucine-rich repeat domain-containing protein [Paraburkholderia sediminicola]|uniref:hypothetical protein n=1 Tax=Paraburkholderia sediminicola TaxID=458836 RepID=UPI0038BCBCC8
MLSLRKLPGAWAGFCHSLCCFDSEAARNTADGAGRSRSPNSIHAARSTSARPRPDWDVDILYFNPNVDGDSSASINRSSFPIASPGPGVAQYDAERLIDENGNQRSSASSPSPLRFVVTPNRQDTIEPPSIASPRSPATPQRETVSGGKSGILSGVVAELYELRDDRIVRLTNQICDDGIVARSPLPAANPIAALSTHKSSRKDSLFGVKLTTLTEFEAFVGYAEQRKCVAVTLEGRMFRDEHLRDLVKKKCDLFVLRLVDCPLITAFGYRTLTEGFVCLQELAVVNESGLADRPPAIQGLQNLEHLQTLSIEKFHSLGDDLFDQLPRIKSLRELSLAGCTYVSRMRQTLKKMPELVQLDLRYLSTGRYINIDLDFLENLTNLKSLFLSGTSLETGAVTRFGNLTRLEVLYVDNITHYNLALPAIDLLLMSDAMPCLRVLVIEQCYLVEEAKKQPGLISAFQQKRPCLTIGLSLKRTNRNSMPIQAMLAGSPKYMDLFGSIIAGNNSFDSNGDDFDT